MTQKFRDNPVVTEAMIDAALAVLDEYGRVPTPVDLVAREVVRDALAA